MAHFLRGKQAGIQNDLSSGLASELFVLDDFARFGINSQVGAFAYDPVQSLLAVGTSDTQYGSGQIYVFGQQRVCVTLRLPRKASVKVLQFCADKLISVDSKNDVSVFSLETTRMLASYAPPGHVTALLTDPSLDYALIGLQNGDIVAYDLDRETLTPFKIPNCWRERNPRARILPIVTMAFHPRDIGSLLIGYSEGAVIFSFKQNKPIKYFHYQVPRAAPGGDSDPSSINEVRHPRLTQALWHPTGTFVLTAHEDSSFVFWDWKERDGKIVMARTLQDTDVVKPGAVGKSYGGTPGTFSLKEPIFRVDWCSKENPDDTGILIAGGSPTTSPTRGLTFFDLGPTPVYATSSWDILSRHFALPRHQHVLPTPPNAEVVDYCLMPRSSPHYAGSHDPIAVITLLSSGELVTLSFPSGHPLTPTNLLHLSLTYVHPFVNRTALACIERTRWLGMRENRSHGPKFLMGGAEAKHPLKRFERRNVVQTAHADGVIRVWDAGHGDEVENENVLQVDLARAVGRFEDIEVTKMSMAGATGELSVGMRSGELVIFRWNHNKQFGRYLPARPNEGPGRMTNILDRADPGLKEGLLPLTLLEERQGPVTALKHSDVGFVCVGFEAGGVAVVDLRGPAVIYNAHLSEFMKGSRRGSIRKGNSASKSAAEWPTCIEFGVMTLEGEDYSSILCFVGTSLGRFATFKILPSSAGTYSVSFAGSCSIDDRILCVSPIAADTGDPAYASQSTVANLRNGHKVNGVIIAATPSGCRIFKPASAKGAHKTWDEFLCDSAAVVRYEGRGTSLVGLFGDGNARSYTIPALKEIGSAKINHILDMKRLSDAIITPTGDVFGWVGPSEMAVLNVWGTGLELPRSADKIFNVQALIPPRPTISNLQWISGTQYVSPSDMDILIGGPDRPPSKRMLEQTRAQEQQQRLAARQGQGTSPRASSAARGGEDETYWGYMQRQVQERTERLNVMGDNMDKLEENSSGWVDDVSKYVNQQKRKAVLGAIGSKFGF